MRSISGDFLRPHNLPLDTMARKGFAVWVWCATASRRKEPALGGVIHISNGYEIPGWRDSMFRESMSQVIQSNRE